MKKILLPLLMLSCCFAVVSCDKKDQNGNGKNSNHCCGACQCDNADYSKQQQAR